jgi:2-dehydro-3-deoxygalactonokinase
VTGQADVIVIDWGASCLRAYLCAESDDGLKVLAQVTGPGVTKVGRSFEAVLSNAIAPWSKQYGALPIFMSGHIGSSLGWHEAPYVFCPVSPEDVAKKVIQFESNGHNIYVVPGISCAEPDAHRDVMRGEETHVLGWLNLDDAHRQGKHLLCLPGTHTKWVLVENGLITVFKTAITGELFDLLSHQSVLIQNQSNEIDMTAFERGVRLTLDSDSGQFVHGLFSVRTLQVLGDLKPEQAKSYLSGVLIGSDVRAALMAPEWTISELSSITLIGSQSLCRLFSKSLEMKNISTGNIDDKQTCLSGFSAIYRAVL